MAAARGYFETSSASPSCPATRWWARWSMRRREPTAASWRREPGWSSNRCSGALLGRSCHRAPACPSAHRRLRARRRHLRPDSRTGFLCRHRWWLVGGGTGGPQSQLHAVPDSFSDEDAVTLEPVACAVHAALAARVPRGRDRVPWSGRDWPQVHKLALTHLPPPRRRPAGAVVVAPATPTSAACHRVRWRATPLAPDQVARSVRRAQPLPGTRGTATRQPAPHRRRRRGPRLRGVLGLDRPIARDGPAPRPRGLVGMPGKVHVDLASLWHREVAVGRTYAYGIEEVAGVDQPVPHLCLAQDGSGCHRDRPAGVGRYPLERFEEAVAHAGAVRRRGGSRWPSIAARRPRKDPLMSPRARFRVTGYLAIEHIYSPRCSLQSR